MLGLGLGLRINSVLGALGWLVGPPDVFREYQDGPILFEFEGAAPPIYSYSVT